MKRHFTLILSGMLLAAAAPSVTLAAKPAAKQAKLATAKLRIEGMSCAGCAQGVAKKLAEVKGVRSAKVDHGKKLGTVQYDPAACKAADLLAAVKQSGYTAKVVK